MNRTELKHSVNMEIAESISKLSTCKFTQVGAVIVNPVSNRIISTGYNGVIASSTHCNNMPWLERDRDAHREWSEKHEIHAEINSLISAAKNGAKTEGCVIYSTVSPCWNCLKQIRAAGITNVFYKNKYWRLDENEIEEQEQTFNCSIKQLS